MYFSETREESELSCVEYWVLVERGERMCEIKWIKRAVCTIFQFAFRKVSMAKRIDFGQPQQKPIKRNKRKTENDNSVINIETITLQFWYCSNIANSKQNRNVHSCLQFNYCSRPHSFWLPLTMHTMYVMYAM